MRRCSPEVFSTKDMTFPRGKFTCGHSGVNVDTRLSYLIQPRTVLADCGADDTFTLGSQPEESVGTCNV